MSFLKKLILEDRDMLKKIFIHTIKVYQTVIAPHLPRACRFFPSCSQYCIMAIEKKGVLRGGLLSCWRILRCNPLSRGGIDNI